ncbi:MAG: hypothetical protein AMXMBFR64_50390 [Myxococcales bacterium]
MTKWMLVLVVLLAGCRSSEQKALDGYVAKVRSAQVHATRYTEARAKLQSWLDSPGEAAPPVDVVRAELLPAQKAYVEALEAIAPDDPAIDGAHKALQRAERRRLNGVFEVDGSLLPDIDAARFRRNVAMLVVSEAEADAERKTWEAALGTLCADRKTVCP